MFLSIQSVIFLGMGGQDPAQMAAMMQNPQVQQMMQQAMNDPAMIQQV